MTGSSSQQKDVRATAARALLHSTSRTFRIIIIQTKAIENAYEPSGLCICDWTKRLKALQLDRLVYLELRSVELRKNM